MKRFLLLFFVCALACSLMIVPVFASEERSSIVLGDADFGEISVSSINGHYVFKVYSGDESLLFESPFFFH